MRVNVQEKLIAYLALISGLLISIVAEYYSIVGLTAIFPTAVASVVVMGISFGIGKLVATVWLKQNWDIAPRFIKIYLSAAISILMFITAMGIFGFLSKAHLDQSVPTGEVAAKIAIIDEKIKVEKENIDSARKALSQMNEAVDQRLSRSNNESGAERAVQIRRAQATERNKLQQEIQVAQKKITQLNEERAPIASQLRKVEAEVGPIKYIAAFVYGQTDQTILEKAVTWVIIIIIVVFDPLAVVLLLSSQISFQHLRDKKEKESVVAVVEEKHDSQFPELHHDAPVPAVDTTIKEFIPQENVIITPSEDVIITPSEEVTVNNTVEEIVPNIPKEPKVDWASIPEEQEYITVDGQHMSVRAAKSLFNKT